MEAAAVKSGQHRFTDAKTERIERAIADYLAFRNRQPIVSHAAGKP
jgi:hypothetical protein